MKASILTGAVKKLSHEANFLSLMGNIAVSFFGFAGFVVLAHHFPPEIFGQWVLYISSAALVDMFRFGITNTAVIRHLSGAEKSEGAKLIGSFILIELVVSIVLAAVIWGCGRVFTSPVSHAGYGLFFTWYPLMMFVTFPLFTAQTILQAELRFDRLLLINLITSAGFFFPVVLAILVFNMNLNQLIVLMLGVNLAASCSCVIAGWDGIRHIGHASAKYTRILLNFGKYTTFTLIGTNLLRGADTLIISLSPMGTAAVALYSIPMKLTELQQIPLRSFAATAFPKMSRASMQGRLMDVRELFYTYSGAMTYLFAFISLVTFIFADFFILILGGSHYVGTDPATGANAANILRVFSIYGLLLPIDRMTGIGLDSVNKPEQNFQKVVFMVMTNVIGDLIAVFVFRSLLAVAIASVIFTVLGAWLGYFFLDRQILLNRKKIFSSGVEFYRLMYHKLKGQTYGT